MAGELVPLVMIPRYTTFAGATTFKTIAMDVTEYECAHISIWRAAVLGGSPTFGVTFEESMDQNLWTDCTGVASYPVDPGAGSEAQYSPLLMKRWFRMSLSLGGADSICTCWAVGFLEERTS